MGDCFEEAPRGVRLTDTGVSPPGSGRAGDAKVGHNGAGLPISEDVIVNWVLTFAYPRLWVAKRVCQNRPVLTLARI